MPSKTPLGKIFTPLVMLVAALYFLLDALFLIFIRPIAQALARLGLFDAITRAIASLGPYTTLALFVVPLILLEPAKPLGLYFMAEGHYGRGIVVIAGAELAKIIIVERIYHIGRPKLMTIPLFARAHDFVMGWTDWFRALPPWQAVTRRFRAIMVWSRTLAKRIRLIRR